MKITLVRPNISFFSWWKMLFGVSFVSTVLSALAWMWTERLSFGYSKAVAFFIGVTYFFLACWNWWVWRPKRQASRWHRWLSGFMYVLYVSGYFWLAGVSFWIRVLVKPINLIVAWLLTSLYVFVLGLPILNHELAKKLYMLHNVIDHKIIYWGFWGTLLCTGIIGYWLQKVLEKDAWMIIVSILCPIVGLGMLQHQSFEAWHSRPWAKEDK